MEVIDYPNYLIYPDGKVYNQKYKRYLRANNDGCGYYYVNLYKDNKMKSHKVHRLVALHYIPKPENKIEVDHINRDSTDNRIENLRWSDRSDNCQNTGKYKNNKLGFKNICYHKANREYVYKKIIRGKRYHRYFKTLTEALCYKYIFILKIKSGVI